MTCPGRVAVFRHALVGEGRSNSMMIWIVHRVCTWHPEDTFQDSVELTTYTASQKEYKQFIPSIPEAILKEPI